MSAPSERTAFTTPTLLSLKELEQTTDATFTTDASPTPSTWIPLHTPHYLRTALLLLATATSAIVAFTGVVVLGYLLATHALTPRQLWYSTPLPLDLVGKELVSSASMLPILRSSRTSTPATASKATEDIKVDSNSRFLPPGQRMDVWLDFTVPELGDGRKEHAELAYVVVDLESIEGQSAARSSQPVLLKSHSALLWRVLSAPLHWAGLLSDDHVISVKVFSNYIERPDIPFANIKVIIKSRGDASPKVLSATVRVHLRVGFISRILYHLRPHSLIALSMGASAICAILGGSIVAGLCIAALIYTFIIRSRQQQGDEGGAKGGNGGRYSRPGSSISGDLSSEAEYELLDGITSSSPGTTPRQLDISEENEQGVAAAGGGGSGSPMLPSPSSKEEKPWQLLLNQIPALGGVSGKTELGGAGMRYRGGGGNGNTNEAAENDM